MIIMSNALKNYMVNNQRRLGKIGVIVSLTKIYFMCKLHILNTCQQLLLSEEIKTESSHLGWSPALAWPCFWVASLERYASDLRTDHVERTSWSIVGRWHTAEKVRVHVVLPMVPGTVHWAHQGIDPGKTVAGCYRVAFRKTWQKETLTFSTKESKTFSLVL